MSENQETSSDAVHGAAIADRHLGTSFGIWWCYLRTPKSGESSRRRESIGATPRQDADNHVQVGARSDYQEPARWWSRDGYFLDQGRGYATEAITALLAFVFGSGRVSLVRAHTLSESNASMRVLTKCGFKSIGEVVDPEDGLVRRWERTQESA